MKIINVNRKELELENYKMRSAVEDDFDTLIDESCLIFEGDTLMIAYLELSSDPTEITSALKRIKYSKGSRTSGLPSTSKIFGFSPRNTLRKDFCASTELSYSQPNEHAIVAKYAQIVADEYRKVNEDLYNTHYETSDKNVMGDYKLFETPFTSGIINKNNPLKYHFDTGNFKDVWSGMIVFKSDVDGGYLSVPEYGLGFYLRNNSLLMFDGQGLLHGVTPIKKLSRNAYRYSIVYYSLRQMWNCLPLSDELLRIRKIKTEREMKRLEKRTKEDFG